MNSLLGFLGGIAVSLLGAIVANVLTRRRERRRAVEERRFAIYMKLMELHGQYWWFTVAEFHGEAVPEEVRTRSHALSWEIADLLRSADEVDDLPEVLDVIFGLDFATSTQRYDAIDRVLDHLGKQVNPRYARKMREISQAHVQMLSAGGRSNAPGAPRALRA
ncbi:MAG: hypothetical protein A3H96_12190 [Acidobacteria bacterium RIFCSPLOWO2_02_FULL_67_36]|nr:MAG: hypothetical protein A3H96_12190 [Acidobacteria bacterium RIFCSPLOWO2_02_FULL_67_36]